MRTRLRDAVERIDYGLTTSAIDSPEGPKFLRITDIVGGALDWQTVPWCQATDKELEKYRLQTGDVVIARTGATTGVSAWIKADSAEDAVFASYLIRLRARADFDSRFLGYVLKTRAWISYVEGVAHGKSAQPNMSASSMGEFEFSHPPLRDQRAIATVLGALDDKIEANRKLAATADVLAAAEFKRAANGVPLSDSTFADVAVIGGGGTPRSKVSEFWGGEVQWLTPTDVTGLPGPYINATSRTITEAGLASISSPIYPVGSIAMTSRATIGAFAILGAPMAVNQGFIVVQPNDPSMRYWLFHEMRRRTREFLDHANGATFMELSRGNFKRLRVHLAAPDAMAAFNAKAESLHNVARNVLRENEHLGNLRDTLLPKLMSGALRVREAEPLVAQAV